MQHTATALIKSWHVSDVAEQNLPYGPIVDLELQYEIRPELVLVAGPPGVLPPHCVTYSRVAFPHPEQQDPLSLIFHGAKS